MRRVDAQGPHHVSGDAVALDETIHQSTRLRIMAMLVAVPESDRLAYGFVQRTLDLTGGNLTTHLRRLEDAGYVAVSKEFVDSRPRTWVRATRPGRLAFAEYLSNLDKALNWQPATSAAGVRGADGPAEGGVGRPQGPGRHHPGAAPQPGGGSATVPPVSPRSSPA